jgi:hypothetical protein
LDDFDPAKKLLYAGTAMAAKMAMMAMTTNSSIRVKAVGASGLLLLGGIMRRIVLEFS